MQDLESVPFALVAGYQYDTLGLQVGYHTVQTLEGFLNLDLTYELCMISRGPWW